METVRGVAQTKGRGHQEGDGNGKASLSREGKNWPGQRSPICGLLNFPGLPAAFKVGHMKCNADMLMLLEDAITRTKTDAIYEA